MFRLTHGEMPRIHHPKVVVLLIGTNDIGYVSKVGGDTSAMAETAEAVVKRWVSLASARWWAPHFVVYFIFGMGRPWRCPG